MEASLCVSSMPHVYNSPFYLILSYIFLCAWHSINTLNVNPNIAYLFHRLRCTRHDMDRSASDSRRTPRRREGRRSQPATCYYIVNASVDDRPKHQKKVLIPSIIPYLRHFPYHHRWRKGRNKHHHVVGSRQHEQAVRQRQQRRQAGKTVRHVLLCLSVCPVKALKPHTRNARPTLDKTQAIKRTEISS